MSDFMILTIIFFVFSIFLLFGIYKVDGLNIMIQIGNGISIYFLSCGFGVWLSYIFLKTVLT